MTTRKLAPLTLGILAAFLFLAENQSAMAQESGMNEMWGEQATKLRADGAKRGELFDVGNYAMFIHWGLYSQIANNCLLYTSPSPRDQRGSRMPSSA